MTKHETLFADIERGYAAGLKPISHDYFDCDGGACAPSAAYVAEHPDYERLDVAFGTVVEEFCKTRHGMTQKEVRGFICGFDGLTPELFGVDDENHEAYLAGLKAAERFLPAV